MLCRRIESGSRSRLAIAVVTAGESNSIAVADSEIRTTAKARGAIFTAMSSSHDARRSRCLRQDLAARLEHAVAFVRLDAPGHRPRMLPPADQADRPSAWLPDFCRG